MITKSREARRARIRKHIQKKVRGTVDRPRLTVYRSLKHLYAQIVDDAQKKTLLSVSTMSKEAREELKALKGNREIAKQVGKLVAKKALGSNIRKVVFDRNGYQYHGVVKALADGVREGGLEF